MSQIIAFLDEIGALILKEAPGSNLKRHFGAEYNHIKMLVHDQEHDLKSALDVINGSVGELVIQKMTFEEGALDIWIKHPLFALFVNQMADMWIEQGAKNYLETSMFSPVIGNFTITLQKQSGKTPHQLKVEAEAKLAEASEKHCVYTIDTEYGSTSCSACNMELVFEEGSAEDSDYKFCPGCGYAIVEFKVKQEPEQEDEL